MHPPPQIDLDLDLDQAQAKARGQVMGHCAHGNEPLGSVEC